MAREISSQLLEPVEVAVVLLEVGRDAQEPGRAADQANLVVAAPAAAVLDLERGERGLAVIAPVDGGVVAVDQPGVEQGEEEPLRPAVLALVGAVEDAAVVKGEAEAPHLGEHPLAAAADPLGGRLLALDRGELGGQAESVEAEAEEHGIAAGAAEARVGVADRVVAHVAHVEVARGERAGGLYVDAGEPIGKHRRLKCTTSRPRLLPGGLHRRGVIGRLLARHLPSMRPVGIEPTTFGWKVKAFWRGNGTIKPIRGSSWGHYVAVM